MRFGRNRQRGESVLGRPALTLDFRLRGYSGRVAVAYEENRDPHSVGFDALGLPFDLALTVGYPTCRATVEYAGPGYRAYIGWIQLVTNHDPATGTETVANDVLPIHRDIDSPFMTFGVAPTFFDAPANPDHDSEDWIADTFLVACPDVARTRCVAALLGFRWGYALREHHAQPLPVGRIGADTWNRHVPLLRAQFPTWEFLAGFASNL
jgi:hypothetical protein